MTSITESGIVSNLDYLNELSKGNIQFVAEMIEIFLSENPEELQSIATGIANKDFDKIKQSVHKLRSTIPFVGIDKIIEAEVCEIEKLATHHEDLSKIATLFSRVKEVCLKATEELKK